MSQGWTLSQLQFQSQFQFFEKPISEQLVVCNVAGNVAGMRVVEDTYLLLLLCLTRILILILIGNLSGR